MPPPSSPSESPLPSQSPSDKNFDVFSGAAPAVVLSIAGYDPSAGAGVLADLKTFAALGAYGMGCITALTIQSTQGVHRVQPVDVSIVVETLDCLAEDACFAAIKVGMLGGAEVAAAVMAWLERHPGVPVVLDPVLKSSSGKDLLDAVGFSVLREQGLARANWITPNLDELEVLTGAPRPQTRPEKEQVAHKLQQMANQRGNPDLKIVVTGGHADLPDDLLLTAEDCRWYPCERIATTSTHGTGCAFSSALATRVAQGDDPAAAVQAAKDYVTGALRHAYPVGKGNGPMDHFWKK